MYLYGILLHLLIVKDRLGQDQLTVPGRVDGRPGGELVTPN